MFEKSETVIVRPKIDLGDILDVLPEKNYAVKCYCDGESCNFPEHDLAKADASSKLIIKRP